MVETKTEENGEKTEAQLKKEAKKKEKEAKNLDKKAKFEEKQRKLADQKKVGPILSLQEISYYFLERFIVLKKVLEAKCQLIPLWPVF